jgi:hypothetical protein
MSLAVSARIAPQERFVTVTLKIMRMMMAQTLRVVFHISPSFADIQAIDLWPTQR